MVIVNTFQKLFYFLLLLYKKIIHILGLHFNYIIIRS
ncbi:hypothetical protein [Staphylococcus phage vB_ScaM-V1SC01]|nr:hypothetical protein [Staphylococcus phage vB_ScaM-V1SC01]